MVETFGGWEPAPKVKALAAAIAVELWPWRARVRELLAEWGHDHRSPVDLLPLPARALTLAERCVILAAVHDVVGEGEPFWPPEPVAERTADGEFLDEASEKAWLADFPGEAANAIVRGQAREIASPTVNRLRAMLAETAGELAAERPLANDSASAASDVVSSNAAALLLQHRVVSLHDRLQNGGMPYTQALEEYGHGTVAECIRRKWAYQNESLLLALQIPHSPPGVLGQAFADPPPPPIRASTEIITPAAATTTPGASATRTAEGPAIPPIKPTKPKRSTERGEGRAKLIAALTKHHKYADGGCLHLEPIGNNALARLADVSESTASEFFNREFGGRKKYRAACGDVTQLVASLKLLNQEFSPHHLFGGKPPDEGERDEEE